MEEAWRKKIHPKANETYFTVYLAMGKEDLKVQWTILCPLESK